MIQLIVRGVIGNNTTYLLVTHVSQDFWCLPGGTVESDEPLVAALERELVEELGVKPQVGPLLFVQQLIEGEVQRVEFFFAITNPQDFSNFDYTATTHGPSELAKAEFIDVTNSNQKILPAFLTTHLPSLPQDGSTPVGLWFEDISRPPQAPTL